MAQQGRGTGRRDTATTAPGCQHCHQTCHQLSGQRVATTAILPLCPIPGRDKHVATQQGPEQSRQGHLKPAGSTGQLLFSPQVLLLHSRGRKGGRRPLSSGLAAEKGLPTRSCPGPRSLLHAQMSHTFALSNHKGQKKNKPTKKTCLEKCETQEQQGLCGLLKVGADP